MSKTETALTAKEPLALLKEIKLPTAVLAADIASNGAPLFAACLDGGIYEVDPESGESRQITAHDSYASGVCHLNDAQLLVSAGYDGVLQWHDLTERKLIRKVAAHRFWSWKLAASPDQALVASATGQVLGWRLQV